MAAKTPIFTEEDMAVDEASGFPKAYAKLCSSAHLSPFLQGPPRAFVPYTLEPQEALRAKELNHMFPIVDPDAKPSANPRGFVNLLWKQLDHLGNAGFDPALFRVDPFGNVLYLHADGVSPLAWDIDHWFPCSRGGRTLPGNLRLLQWQVCKKKRNRLDFLLPWWDLQLGISVNQFLSIFASRNSDFRNRAFSFLFAEGGSEELTSLQTVESHSFPQHFIDMKQKVGLAPAAVVASQRSHDVSILKPLDFNRSSRRNSPLPASRKFPANEDDALNMAIHKYTPSVLKENEQPDTDDYSSNPYLSITRARDSLRQKEESKKKQAEINGLDDELEMLMQKNEEERLALQDLETVLIKRRRRVEKCRRLAEAQASYKALLEKMIRDAMHQSVVYKEQVRLNKAATNSLMARLEVQRATCDTSENELRRKFKQRDELEKQIRPCWEEQARKRSRMEDTLLEERHEGIVRAWNPLKKELRVFLEEEQKASEAGLSRGEEEESGNSLDEEKDGKCKAMVPVSNTMANSDELKKLRFREGKWQKSTMTVARDELPLNCMLKELSIREEGNSTLLLQNKQHDKEEDDEYRNQVGKGNVEKWLHMMLENAKEEEGSSSSSVDSPTRNRVDGVQTEEIVEEPPNGIDHTQEEMEYLKLKPLEEKSYGEEIKQDKQKQQQQQQQQPGTARSSSSDNRRNYFTGKGVGGGRKSFERKEGEENRSTAASCESSRGFRSFPSSPSMILGMRRGVDCMGKKPKVMDDVDEEGGLDLVHTNRRIIRSCSETIKKAVNKR